MDIHRCRFIPYQPAAINAIAVSHSSTRNHRHVQATRVAIGRANGDIEIWNPLAGAWHQETVLRGGRDRSIEGLSWIVAPDRHSPNGTVIGRLRLFSIGYSSTVTEWDLEKGMAKAHISGTHGDIWCLAAQPIDKLSSSNQVAADSAGAVPPMQKLAVGTADGEIALYAIEHEDLEFVRVIVRPTSRRVKSRIVSLSFQSANVIIAGCSDGTIGVHDLRGTQLHKISLSVDRAGDARGVIVWCVKCLSNGYIISGDSTGCVCIWDGRTYTLTQKLQLHKQDVLSITASADGADIISGGMDRRTALTRLDPGSFQRWSRVWTRQYHSHDVKALAAIEIGTMSVAMAGGPDACPVIIPIRQLGRENHRALSSLPQCPPMMGAVNGRLLISWWDRQIHIWRLSHSFSNLANLPQAYQSLDENRQLVKTIVIKGGANITSAAISDDGSLLVVSTVSTVKAFYLRHHHTVKPSDINIFKIALPSELTSRGATKLQLSPDGRWLCLIQNVHTLIIASFLVTSSSGHPTAPVFQKTQRLKRIRRDIPTLVRLGGLGNYNRTIVHVAFSRDGSMLATADLAGYVDTFVLRVPSTIADDDQFASSTGSRPDGNSEVKGDTPFAQLNGGATTHAAYQSWFHNPTGNLIPKLPAAPVVLTFSDDEHHPTLLAITTSWHILAFNSVEGGLLPWSRRHPPSRLPSEIVETRDLAKGVLWQGRRIWIYGVSFVCMLDLSQDISRTTPIGREKAERTADGPRRAKRTKRPERDDGAGSLMEVGNLVPKQVRRLEAKLAETGLNEGQERQSGGWEDVDMDTVRSGDEMELLEDAADPHEDWHEGKELALQRHQNDVLPDTGGQAKEGRGRSWWLTYKYRPILGMVPLAAQRDVATSEVTGLPSLEVALVERPAWNIELPDRYLGQDEWER